MPSNNKNIIGDLRGRFDPHYKLASNVEGIEKGLGIEVAQIHKTLSKSFAMQRKTLVRVLGLEKRVNVLELEQAEEEQAKEGIDEILENIHQATPEEVAEYNASVPMTEAEKEFAAEESKFNAVDKAVATKKKLNLKKTKITGEAFKKGTSQESLENIRPDKSQNPDISEFFGESKPDVTSDAITPEVLPPEDEQKQSPFGDALKNILTSIAGTTESIKNLLQGQQQGDRDAAQDAAKEKQDAARSGKEKKMESRVFEGMKKMGEKVIAPVKSLWERVWGFLKTLLFSAIVGKLFNWFQNPKNQKKVKSIFKFVSDFWPILLTGFLLFGTGIGSLITGTVAAITGFIPVLMGFIPALAAFLASPIGLAVLGTAAVVGGGMYLHNKFKDNKNDPSRSAKDRKNNVKKEKTVEMNKGGVVPGSGNTDTVPAMLTPGEFVVTKGATEKYGTDTLEGMNAAAESGKKETSGIGRGIGSAVGGLAGGVVGFFADSPVSPVADIALGMAGSAAGGEIGDNVERKVRGMNKGGTVPGSGNKDTVPAMLTPGEFVMSKGAVQQYGVKALEGMNAAAGGTNKPTMGRYKGGGKATGVVTDPKERQQQEAYMLKYVNEERALQGLEPLTNLTYAPGVELTKAVGPGPRTKETSNTNFDFNTGLKTTSKSKTVDGKTIFSGGMSLITEEEKQKFFAANPHAKALLDIKNQAELDNLGADISASAKMNGGGLVQGFAGGGLVSSNSVSNFSTGGLVQAFQNGGMVASGLDFKNKQVNSVPKSPNISPPPSSSNSSVAAKITSLKMDGNNNPINLNQDEAPSEVPDFSATMMRSRDKIKTLGIMV